LPAVAGQSGARAGESRFRGYNQYALDTLRIVDTFGVYAAKTGDLAKHEQYTRLHDRFASIGIRAQELLDRELDREAESAVSAYELEEHWRDLVRRCIALREEIDPALIQWVSKEDAAADSSSNPWSALAGTEAEVPDDVLVEIRQQAAREHPDDDRGQQRAVQRQIKAYRQWQAYERMRSAPYDVYRFVQEKAAGDYPGDYVTQLRVLDRQMAAYEQVRQCPAPPGMAATHLVRIKEKAATAHPGDFSTQLFVIQQSVDTYLRLRRRGANRDAIVRYLLDD
jgi:hypothetical protein